MEEDAIILAVFFGAAIAFWLLRRSMQNQDAHLQSGEPVAVPSRPAAFAGREYWDRYDAKEGWNSSVATDKKEKLAGGKQGRPLDAVLPRREYIPKKPKWAGSGTASSSADQDDASRDWVEEHPPVGGGNEDDCPGSDGQEFPEAVERELGELETERRDDQVGPNQEEDEVWWKAVPSVKLLDTTSGIIFQQKLHEKAEEGWRLDEKVVRRLLLEGFGIRAATRAALVSEGFDDCLVFLFRRLEDGWVNAAWSNEEVDVLGRDWISRLEELEREVLAAAAQRSRQTQQQSRIDQPDDELQETNGAVGPAARRARASARGEAAFEEERRADAGDGADVVSSSPAARSPTKQSTRADVASTPFSAAAPAEHKYEQAKDEKEEVQEAKEKEEKEEEQEAAGGVGGDGLREVLLLDHRDVQRATVRSLLEQWSRTAHHNREHILHKLVSLKMGLHAWTPLQETFKADAVKSRRAVELPAGTEYCARVWLLLEGREAGGSAEEALMCGVLAALTEGCPRPDEITPPASSKSFQPPGLVAEASALLGCPTLTEAFISFLDGRGDSIASVDSVFSRILEGAFDVLSRARQSSDAPNADRDAAAALCIVSEIGRCARLRSLLTRSFETQPYSKAAQCGPRAADLFQFSPLSAGEALSLDDPAAAGWYRAWFKTMSAVTNALPIRDMEFRSAFLSWTARALQPSDSNRFSHASTTPLLPSLAVALGVLARPFLSADSPLHRAWTRFDASWYSKSGRVDVSAARKLRWWSGQGAQQGAASRADDDFALSTDDADALAAAVQASMRAARQTDSDNAGLLEVDGGEGAGGEGGYHLVTELWMLVLEGLHCGAVPVHSALKHCQNEKNKATEAAEKTKWESKSAAMKLMLGGIGGGGGTPGWGGWEMNYAETGEVFLGVASMAMAWVAALRGSAASLQHIPEYVLYDALHVVWCCWMDTPAQFLSSTHSLTALGAFPALISRSGGLSSSFLRYRFADVIVQVRERDVHQGKSRWDSRMSQLEASEPCRKMLAVALAELFTDVEGVTPAEAHAFDKNAARGRLATLMLHLLATDCFLDSLAHLAPSVPPGMSKTARTGRAGSAATVHVLEGFLHAVVGDGAFVLQDALGRLADIRAMQVDMEGEAWKQLPDHVRQDRTNLHRQLEGVAVHFLRLAKTNLALLELLLSHPSVCSVMCSGDLGARFGGFLHLSVAHLCGHKSRQLHLQDKARYGFDPKELVEHLCGLIGKASSSREVTSSLRVGDVPSVYQRLLRIAATKLSLAPGTTHALTSWLEPLLKTAPTTHHDDDGGEEARESVAGGRQVAVGEAGRKPWTATAAQVATYKQALQGMSFSQVDMCGASGAYDHHYRREIRESAAGSGGTRRVRRLLQEMHSLAQDGCLPISPDAAIFVRADEARTDVVKVLLSGPTETPYAFGLWELHVFFSEAYPASPPLVHLETTGNGLVRFNPNLYSDGKVCLSLLGTWHGEGWNPASSTLLQVLVSIQSLIMVKEPYFNEPGYELQRGSEEGTKRSQQYNDNVHLNSIRYAMIRHLRQPPAGFEDAVRAHFASVAPALLAECALWIETAADDEVASELRGATAELSRVLETVTGTEQD